MGSDTALLVVGGIVLLATLVLAGTTRTTQGRGKRKTRHGHERSLNRSSKTKRRKKGKNHSPSPSPPASRPAASLLPEQTRIPVTGAIGYVNRSAQLDRSSTFIGIGYVKDKQNRLFGCGNDTKAWRDRILPMVGPQISQGTTELLTDDPAYVGSSTDVPTMQGVIDATGRLLMRTTMILFWMYSGHGMTNAQHQESIVPVDFKRSGLLKDTMLRAILVDSPLRLRVPGQKLVCLFDCCHSERPLKLAYHWAPTDRVTSEGTDGIQASRSSSYRSPFYTEGPAENPPGYIAGGLPRSIGHVRVIHSEHDVGRARSISVAGTSDPITIALSACRDDQTDADAFLNGRACGALSYAVEQVCGRHHGRLTWGELLTGIYLVFRKLGFNQVPQLECSHNIDLNTYVVF